MALLGNAAVHFARSLASGSIPATVVAVLDQLLLILMIVEILYTVQVSFATIRRLLVLTAEFARLVESNT